MNKKRMGQFLKKLRTERGWSQEDLSDQFAGKNFIVSVKAISDWENGKTVPEIEKLTFLSELYGASIDEILDGERLQEKNYFKEYPFANENWPELFADKNYDIYSIHQKHRIKVAKRFKELLIKKINDEETKNEDSEFKFLFNHFYALSDYADEFVRSKVNDRYLKLVEAIQNKVAEMKDAKKDALFFEVSKFICPTKETEVRLNEIVDGVLSDNQYADKRFKMLEWWEKDMLLMSLQQGDVVFDPSEHGATSLKRFETNNGREFDKDECVRTVVKYMIENGACLNYQFINIIVKKRKRKRIIDRVEELYLQCEKPLECPYMEDGKTFTNYVENNRKNRFIVSYYHSIERSLDFLNLDFDELYDFVWKYDPENVSEDLLILLSKGLGIDTNRDLKYVRADFNQHSYALEPWKKYRAEEKKIDRGLIELRDLEEKLRKGETRETFEEEEYVGGKDSSEMAPHFQYWREITSFDELKKTRDKEKTKQLLENLASYSLQDIRDIYMKEELMEGETCEQH